MIPDPVAAVRIWSEEQDLIFHDFEFGQGNLVVDAYAGTGKTTTIVEAIQRVRQGRILLAAFNTRIKDELAAKNQNPNAEVKTLHGVGFSCLLRYWEGIRAGNSRREFDLAQEVCGDQVPDAIKRLVGKACSKAREIAPHAHAVGDLRALLADHDLEPDEEWEDAGYAADYVEARALEAMELAASVKPAAGIDFADMLYLPVRNKWMARKYDMVVVDERQDMTVTQLELAKGVCKAAGRIVLVGDKFQAIYGFRGADTANMDALDARLGAQVRKLSTTYRCPKAVVALAAVLAPGYRAAETAPDGIVRSLPSVEALVAAAEPKADAHGKPHDFILSRKNAPLARIAMAFIRARKRVRIQGRDIGAGLIALVRTLAKGKAADSLPAFLERLARWQEREILRAQAADRDDKVEGIRDKADTLVVVAEGATGVRDVVSRLEDLFADTGTPESIVCSSVHKAKGLEAQRVFVLRRTLNPRLPKGKTRTPAQAREELNIEYVAITRAQHELVWVEAEV